MEPQTGAIARLDQFPPLARGEPALLRGSPNNELSAFCNLEHLSLDRICGDFTQRRTDIANILSNSPNLKSLALSLHDKATKNRGNEFF
jgi:hypothetical protein